MEVINERVEEAKEVLVIQPDPTVCATLRGCILAFREVLGWTPDTEESVVKELLDD